MNHLYALPNLVEFRGHESKNTVSWPTATESFLTFLKAGGSPQTTVYARKQHLEHAARRLPAGPYEITAADLTQYFAAQRWAPETRRGRRATFRKFYEWAIANGFTATSPADAIPAVKAAAPNPRPAPDAIFFQALLKAGPREKLMIRLAAEMGLRRAEVAVAHTQDIERGPGGASLTVHGKGGKIRVLPIPDGLASQLLDLPEGYFFPGDDNGHLSPRYVGKLITRLMPEGWTMHTLRHRCATRAWNLDHDLLTVQALMGHASPATTQRYIRQDDQTLRAMLNRLAA